MPTCIRGPEARCALRSPHLDNQPAHLRGRCNCCNPVTHSASTSCPSCAPGPSLQQSHVPKRSSNSWGKCEEEHGGILPGSGRECVCAPCEAGRVCRQDPGTGGLKGDSPDSRPDLPQSSPPHVPKCCALSVFILTCGSEVGAIHYV